MNSVAIETAGLVKTFGDNRAVDGVDLTIPAGTVYGLLGPNGAGKTTTVKMLATLLRPDGGDAHVFGHDVVREADAVRSRASLTGQYASVDEDLTGTENLVLLARLTGHGKKAAYGRAGQLLEAFGLSDAAARQVKSYSGGMRRRLVAGLRQQQPHHASRLRGPRAEAGTAPGSSLAWALGWVVLLVAVFGPVTMRLYNRK